MRHDHPDTWRRLAEAEVRAVLASLPAPLRERLTELPVRLEARPGPELLEEGLPDDLLGLFSGASFAEGATSTDPLPPSVSLYLENLRDEAEDDPARFRQEVRTTLLHEIGHFLGLEEDGLAARDLE